MKPAKIIIALSFLLAFALQVSAQNEQTINSLRELNYLAKGKIKDLQFTVSTKEDVKRVFGENCERNCLYENDWDIYFRYFDDEWVNKTTLGNNELIYKPKPEFIGKLGGIVLYPKTQIFLSENAEFSGEFECRDTTFTSVGKYSVSSRLCIENEKVIYIFSKDTLADRKISKGQIILVQFTLSNKESDKILALINK